MKKTFSFMLSILLCLSLIGCGNSDPVSTTEGQPEPVAMRPFPTTAYLTDANGVKKQAISTEITENGLVFTYHYPDGATQVGYHLQWNEVGEVTALTQFRRQGNEEILRERKIIRDKENSTVYYWNYDPIAKIAKVDTFVYCFDREGRVIAKTYRYDTWVYHDDGTYTVEKDLSPQLYAYIYDEFGYHIQLDCPEEIDRPDTEFARPYFQRYTTTIPYDNRGIITRSYSYHNPDGTPTAMERTLPGMKEPVLLSATVEEYRALDGLQLTAYRHLADGTRVLEKKENTTYNVDNLPADHNGNTFTYTDGKLTVFTGTVGGKAYTGSIQWGEIPAPAYDLLATLLGSGTGSPFLGLEDVLKDYLPYSLYRMDEQFYKETTLFP